MRCIFKHVELKDRELVHRWLREPYVTKWFYGQGLQNTIDHLDKFLQGVAGAQYWLAYDQETPFAFLITSDVKKPSDELACWCSKEGSAITLDMLIGDPNYLGKGYSCSMIQQFLSTHFPKVSEVLIDPEASNSRAVHVYEKAGFKKLGEFIPSHSPNLHYMMRLDIN